ncbi:unnamed protein product [Phytophthora lilii]|uniref:Unnamed protein product n=1 Tax=Phytophthora lilii TaxID=2077276 RepID=A0A9W6XB06_9STRA|nr:unnamed protein product [Phytophthora lilii]
MPIGDVRRETVERLWFALVATSDEVWGIPINHPKAALVSDAPIALAGKSRDQRFLRSLNAEVEDKISSDDNGTEEERTSINLNKLDDETDELAIMIKTFKEWDGLDYPTIALSMYQAKATSTEFGAMYRMYLEYKTIGADKLLQQLKSGTIAGRK